MFVEWGGLNNLKLNVTKMKDLIVDLRRQRTSLNAISINGIEVDIVSDCKYLGINIKLRSFNVH